MDRDRLIFRYFFNAGVDKETGICDGEGSDVFELDDEGQEHYLGSIYGHLPSEFSEMEDGEVEYLLIVYGIISPA